MRLFAALVPPAEVLAEVDEALAEARRQLPELRWESAARMHLTLAFYGEVTDVVAQRLQARLARACSRHPALTLAFAGAGAFPRRARASVFWLAVTGDRQPLVRLAGSLGAAGRRVGLAMDERTYRPHLTVGRAKKQPCDVRAQVAQLEDYRGPDWRATEVALVRSHLGPQPRYETVAAWPLAGG
ncbi:MAG: RNA 2',3'-cyclic phosphodiesterase [Streptosporangiales bacterium]|nr:RNA 2',3'-cyclic phosphodiesterase [Streptosporangiales bacterium]